MAQVLAKKNKSTPVGASPLSRFPAGRKRLLRRLLFDRLSSWGIALGGWLVIMSVLAIFLVILWEVMPLFRGTRVTPGPQATIDSKTPPGVESLGFVVDEYLEKLLVFSSDGSVTSSRIAHDSLETRVITKIPSQPTSATSLAYSENGEVVFAYGDGSLGFVKTGFETHYRDGKRTVVAESSLGETFQLDKQGRAIEKLAFISLPSKKIVLAQVADNEVLLYTQLKKRALMGSAKVEVFTHEIILAENTRISSLLLDPNGSTAYLGTSEGELLSYQLASPTLQPKEVFRTKLSQSEVTILGLLLGEQTLVSGHKNGEVKSWLLKKGASTTGLGITEKSTFEPHKGAVQQFSRAGRNKGFATGDEVGEVKLHYGTTGETISSFTTGVNLSDLRLSPKADAIVALSFGGKYSVWTLDNPHPEVNLRALFGKILYEGYQEPQYSWQSSGASDRFESKYSLIPLLFGTLKGTLYALIFAIPLAVFGALYTSQFMHPKLKAYIKPLVELMAALPSVVIGFIAGLWLAPRLDELLFGVFLLPLLIPLSAIGGLFFWSSLPRQFTSKLKPGMEILPLVGFVALGFFFSLWAGAKLDASLTQNDFQSWLRNTFGIVYDQRNSIVVGIAMGFAVIPIIFTITEDCLSSVPKRLVASSLALGATRWQTALRVVIPSASPGVFSAIMIGFGRAVGETMIVLMATGNTPLLDWSAFNGFRAMSANIAVELPEAPHGGSLYRILFLTALLLFIFTFLLNMLSEIVRLRLRRKYEVEL